MKELSIEEKARRYDETLERARAMIKVADNKDEVIGFTNTILPELEEFLDEKILDEKIRKAILNYLTKMFGNCQDDVCGVHVEDAIDWIEKQGQTFTKKDIDDAYLKGVCDAKQELENQCEQKPIDKVEPKFKIGDWITNGEDLWKIINASVLDYVVQSQNGEIVHDTICFVDKHFRKWTIQDSKDGDVLIDKSGNRECPFIFKETKPSDIKTGMPNPLAVLGYCGFGWTGFTKGRGWGDTANCIYYPATKEQRDTLTKAMTDAGYTFDFEKKELKKIKFRVGDEIVTENEGSLTITRIDEEGYWSNDLFICDFDSECIWDLVEQKSAWSEEDEDNIFNIVGALDVLIQREIEKEHNGDRNAYPKYYRDLQDWLKSLKERYTWKPSDKQINAFEHFVRSIGESGHASPYENNTKLLYSLLEQLKKLTEE